MRRQLGPALITALVIAVGVVALRRRPIAAPETPPGTWHPAN